MSASISTEYPRLVEALSLSCSQLLLLTKVDYCTADLRRTHGAPYVMATRPPKEDLALPAPPIVYCARYEGNRSKRWDGKSILIDTETLLMLVRK